jgi:hypothetical protein
MQMVLHVELPNRTVRTATHDQLIVQAELLTANLGVIGGDASWQRILRAAMAAVEGPSGTASSSSSPVETG